MFGLGNTNLKTVDDPDNRLTDGGEVISITRRPRFTPQEDFW
jgi:hypothetical protein